MRKSTLARLMLLCYGINFTAVVLAAIFREWLPLIVSGFFVGYCSWWLGKNYFDVENANDNQS